MSEDNHEKAIISAALAAIAVFLGVSRNSKKFANLAKDVVSRLLNLHVQEKPKPAKKVMQYKRYDISYENKNSQV